MKAMVLAIRSFSSGMVFSVSAQLGTSTPASRAAAPLAVSEAIWIWPLSGIMSGARRAEVSTSGSIFLASAKAWALSRMAERAFRVVTTPGTSARWTEMDMVLLWGCRNR